MMDIDESFGVGPDDDDGYPVEPKDERADRQDWNDNKLEERRIVGR